MHKHTAAVLGAALLAALPGCIDLNEDPISGLTPTAYGTRAVFEALVNASYEPLRSFYAQERGFTVTEFGTDIFTKGADGSHKPINDYTTQLNPDESFFRDTWVDFYRAINTTNAAIGQAALVTMDSTLKAQRVGEARFLRALYYFDLVQMFGPVTLRLQETTTPTTEATRAPVDSVYEAIIRDLQYAEGTLPDMAKDYGRATRGAAQHLLAKVYLTRMRDTNAVADEAAKLAAGDFANAADYARRVINSGQYRLLDRFADVFDFSNERNSEVIWSVQFTGDPLTTGPGNKGHLYFLMEYDVLPGMLRDIANGRPFKRFRPTWYLLGLYDRTMDARYDAQFTRVWYANNPATIPKDAFGVPTFRLGDTAVYVSTTDADTLLAKTRPYRVYTPKAYRSDGSPNPLPYADNIFPSLNKFHDAFRLSVNDERGSRDFFVARLADTYLIAAEALLRDGRPAEALPYLNAVRRRAAIPGHEVDMELTLGQLTLDEILNERARELAGEMQRWFDLVRTHTLLARVKAFNPDAKNNIKWYHVLRPIPQIQIDRTTNGYQQNPGY
ncbi:MAG TPA: RagB/SusD family nutrient uptake outer membrane protein [Gemmatimonadales bacterium]|nr:RagB/SusD family nutrient uptake outer membrane protein [Gemmatimonadales bacterium]